MPVPLLALAAIASLILLGALSQMTAAAILDDAFMFARYADNLTADGTAAWNPRGQATYGTTSLLYLILIVPFRLLIPTNSARIAHIDVVSVSNAKIFCSFNLSPIKGASLCPLLFRGLSKSSKLSSFQLDLACLTK